MKITAKKAITLENLIYLYLILCPILDVSSFLFRQHFQTFLSISTVVRPIIPICLMIYIFFKDKIKLKLICFGLIYGLYAIIHLYLFKNNMTSIAYGDWKREAQYLVNYTFMIMNLFLYIYVVFLRKQTDNDKKIKEENNEECLDSIKKLKKVVLITFTIYIALMYIAILSGTSSYTYTEDLIGKKGWFESGNSVGTLMLICLCVVLPMTQKENDKWVKIVSLIDIILSGIYLSMLLGTRTGLFGFLLVGFIYIVLLGIYKLFHGKTINKKVTIIGSIVSVFLIAVVLIFGSNTLKRRKMLQEREDLIYDPYIQESAHVTGDLVEMAHEIELGNVDNNYISEDMQHAILDLYKYNNEHKVAHTNMRKIQLVYHTALVKEQKSIPLILFGNGYMSHFRELIFEMEVPAFLYNFGIFGFILYFVPFLLIAIYIIINLLRNRKKAKVENYMTSLAFCIAIAFASLAGYTFFNASTTTLIIAACVLGIEQLDGKKWLIKKFRREQS